MAEMKNKLLKNSIPKVYINRENESNEIENEIENENSQWFDETVNEIVAEDLTLTEEYMKDFERMKANLEENTLDQFQSTIRNRDVRNTSLRMSQEEEYIRAAIQIVRQEEILDGDNLLTSDYISRKINTDIEFNPQHYNNYEMSSFEKVLKAYINNAGLIKKCVMAIAIFVLLIGSVYSAEAFRFPIPRLLLERFDEFSISYVEESELKQSIKFDTYYKPSYIPFGFTQLEETQSDSSYKINYQNPNGDWIKYEQLLGAEKLYYDTEGATIEKIDILDFSAYYVEKDHMNTIVFNKGDYNFKLISILDKQEIIKVAESIFM